MVSSLNGILSNTNQTLYAVVPSQQLLKNSVSIEAVAPKRLSEWSLQDHRDSYSLMQAVVRTWKSGSYLLYSKIDANSPFSWEIVPYQKCRNCITVIVQQLQVLWRVAFGGVAASDESRKNQTLSYKSQIASESSEIRPPLVACLKGSDPFCQPATIERQWVFKGDKVDVLFSHAPIGFGGEKLHFLVIPKEHRETFADVTSEEYSESMMLTAKLVDHFTSTRADIKHVYIRNANGPDAGQAVKHWNLHLIFCNRKQDFWGKLAVVKNILFGSSPMKAGAFQERVEALRREISSLKIERP